MTLPAVWVMAGIATLQYGLLPRFAAGGSLGRAWRVLAFKFAGELHRVSQSGVEVSPFAHVHWAAPVSFTSLVGLTTVAAALTTVGLLGFQRRDFTV